jgi:hypothetical protein
MAGRGRHPAEVGRQPSQARGQRISEEARLNPLAVFH